LATTGCVEMNTIERLPQFDTAICAAMSLKSAYAKFAAAVQSCVTERLRAAGVVVEKAHDALIADAVNEVIQDTIYGLGRDELASLESHVAEAVGAAVRIVITTILHQKTA
jgi:predicted metal-dependent phosphoesterase TrpH